MATKAQLEKRVSQLQGIYERYGHVHRVSFPKGIRLAKGHESNAEYQHDAYVDNDILGRPAELIALVYDRLLDDLADGAEPCNDPDCEECNP